MDHQFGGMGIDSWSSTCLISNNQCTFVMKRVAKVWGMVRPREKRRETNGKVLKYWNRKILHVCIGKWGNPDRSLKNALADLGASINFMPHSLFLRLGISKLKPIRISIQLADRSIKYPIGVCKNLLVKINKFIFPVDFVVLVTDEDELVPIIFGRSFLATARAVIDVHEGKLSLRVRKETVTFNIGKLMKSAYKTDDTFIYTARHDSETQPRTNGGTWYTAPVILRNSSKKNG
ncbi:retrovirus-related pol polyprotein from transposon 17.6 [Tanacetum coccineum]